MNAKNKTKKSKNSAAKNPKSGMITSGIALGLTLIIGALVYTFMVLRNPIAVNNSLAYMSELKVATIMQPAVAESLENKSFTIVVDGKESQFRLGDYGFTSAVESDGYSETVKYTDSEGKNQTKTITTKGSICFDETGAQEDGTIVRNVHFPKDLVDSILSGPHFGVANPLFQSSQRDCSTRRAFDKIDLNNINNKTLQRCNYSPACSMEEYIKRIPNTIWNKKYNSGYRLITRKMLNLSSERTLTSAIIPPNVCHIITVYGLITEDLYTLGILSGLFSSVPYDFLIKVLGNASFLYKSAKILPILSGKYIQPIVLRSMLLNCLTDYYKEIWEKCWNNKNIYDSWSKKDTRLKQNFSALKQEWDFSNSLKTEFERRQALVEIDVLTAMQLGMSLEKLIDIYKIQFPVAQQYEEETWYDQKGNIVFTNNRSLTNVGLTRNEFEQVKYTKEGKIFTQTIMDDTLPGGPSERTIEYVAPFDKCDRIEDYKTAWKFFKDKYESEE